MYRRLNLLLSLIAALGITAACNKSSSPDTTSIAGYELVSVPGSDVSKAVKKDGGGTVAEEGYVLNGQRHGLWLTFHPDRRIATMQHYIDGKLNGVSLTLDNRGQITNKAFYTNNEYDGQKATFRFGRVQEVVPYSMGVIDGRAMKYYTNGKVMEEIDYQDGKQHGYYRHYNEEGVVDLEYVYENGDKVSGGIVSPEQQ